jgi:hypothetical protein
MAAPEGALAMTVAVQTFLGTVLGKAIVAPVWLALMGAGMPWLTDPFFHGVATVLRQVIG